MGCDTFEAVGVDGSGDEFCFFRDGGGDGMVLVFVRMRRRRAGLLGVWFFGVVIRVC